MSDISKRQGSLSLSPLSTSTKDKFAENSFVFVSNTMYLLWVVTLTLNHHSTE